MTRVYDGEWVVSSLLAERAERFGDEIAVRSFGGDLSYADLVLRAARVAGALDTIGIQPGDRVATMLDTGIDYLAAWHGIVWRNAIDVPINSEYKGVFLEHILRDSGARALFVDGRWLARLQKIDLGDLEHVIVVGDAAAEIPESLMGHSFADALAHDEGDLVPRGETDPTYIMYTSGTTGPAKGAIHNNRSSMHYIMPFVEGLELTDDDVCYSMFPLFHQMGRSSCTTTSLWTGNLLVLRNGFSAGGFWDDIRDTGATWMGYFGAVVHFLWLQEPDAGDRDHRLTRAFGAAAPPELIVPWQDRFGVTLYECYGSTEIGLGSGLGSGPRKLGTMGLPCKHVELQIADENDEPLPAGQVGQALWRPRFPDAFFQGYWERPEATVEAWRNLWFHSGDAGYMDEEGYFVFRDRIKDSIRRRGENISSFSVEEAVRAEPGVLECAAYAVASDVIGAEEEVMIAIVPEAEGAPEPAVLFRALCESMPRHAVPRYLRFMDELPKTPTQRVRKFMLRDAGITSDAVDREALGIFPVKE
jgi:crotonobetaine/carnitine-CoA ligase